jgi:hypothetical protein
MATVAHRSSLGSHDKISACDWPDTFHRGSKWQEVTIFSNIRTADRGSKSQSHFTNIFRTKNDELRVAVGYCRSKHSTSANEGFSLPPRQAFLRGFLEVLNLLHLRNYIFWDTYVFISCIWGLLMRVFSGTGNAKYYRAFYSYFPNYGEK